MDRDDDEWMAGDKISEETHKLRDGERDKLAISFVE